ncbi:MAG TPA: hypothetical protein VGZ22_05005 [Isosphaeraceae bacterium]|jgi:hypothetical protein|nr:hypothetical protein [Isosphaeraceae bacterium]
MVKEKLIHARGLVSFLKQIHDELDAAVFEAYGWPPSLTDEEILERLVALNAERAREKERGLIRWLRPEFQNPEGKVAAQGNLPIAVENEAAPAAASKKAACPGRWPSRPRRCARPWRRRPEPSRPSSSPAPSIAPPPPAWPSCSPPSPLSARPAPWRGTGTSCKLTGVAVAYQRKAGWLPLHA